MIAQLHGVVMSASLQDAVISVHGVGFRVSVTANTASALRVGEPATLFTSMVVREDSMTLYGFDDDDARIAFETVQLVSGVGPRLALAMLALLSPEELRQAVANEDVTTLMKVPGVGKKSASRIILELADRLGPPTAPGAAAPAARAQVNTRATVCAALVGLGWSTVQAEQAVDAVDDSTLDQAGLLKAALQRLGGRA